MLSRSLEYKRRMRYKHIQRKKRIIKNLNNYWHYKFDGELDCGKIHCSCPMCSPKTRNKGHRNKANYDRALHYKHSELKRQIDMDEQESEYQSFNKGSKRKRSW